MNENQKSIVDWAGQAFGRCSLLALSMKIEDEVNELRDNLSALVRTEDLKLKDSSRRASLEECADVFILLCQIAERLDGDLMEAVAAKMRINRARQWRRLPDGRFQPVENYVKASGKSP